MEFLRSDLFFYIWFTGCVVSLWTVIKHAPLKDMMGYAWWNIMHGNREEKTAGIDAMIVIVVVAFIHVLLSWFGALATYLTFNEERR